MKKLIPAFIAIVLIGVVVYFSFGKNIVGKYSYGTEKADLNDYFQIFSADAVPIILGNIKTEESGKLINGKVYFDLDTVRSLLTRRFYHDSNENLLLYTSDKVTYKSEVGSTTYNFGTESASLDYSPCIKKGGAIYIALDYIQNFVDFEYELFSDPYHMILLTSWEDKTVATVKNDTDVRWRAGVKSEILTSVKKGDVVETIEVLDDWKKVLTADGFVGYVQEKFLEDETIQKASHVRKVPEEQYTSLTKNTKINLVWNNIEYPQNADYLYNACAKIKSVNVISPTWYWLSDNEGNFESIATEDYVKAAHRMGMEVWPLVANFHTGTNVDLSKVITFTSKREKLIEGLVAETVKYGCEGINLDFESVPPETGDSYIQFVRELSLACHANNLILSVDNYAPTAYTAFYNREEQGRFADYVIIMGYDEHYSGSDAGSVSSIPWMTEGIKKTLEEVPANKVINAIPFYTRVWKTKDGDVSCESVTMATSQEFIKRNKLEPAFDAETGQYYAEKTIGSTFYQVWLEETESVKARLNIMNTLGIAGVAEWRLGQETADIWDVIESYMAY